MYGSAVAPVVAGDAQNAAGVEFAVVAVASSAEVEAAAAAPVERAAAWAAEAVGLVVHGDCSDRGRAC